MTKLTPKNINGTIGNNKIIKKLDDNTFAEVTANDITALGFTQSSGGPVNGLDGISTDTTLNSKYRANYRGETVADIGSLGRGCWYDNIGQKIFMSRDNQIAVYDTQWNQLSTITVSGGGGFLQGNNTTRSLYTLNGSQKINMDTLVVSGSIGGTLLDISPDGSVGISLTANTRQTAGGSLTITAFNTSNMSIIDTFTKTNTSSNLTAPVNAIGGATLISNTDFVLAYTVRNQPGDPFVGLDKFSIPEGGIVQTHTISTNNSNMSSSAIQYSPVNNLIYYIRGASTGLRGVYTITTSFTSDTLVYEGNFSSGFLNSNFIKGVYRMFDNSIGMCINYGTGSSGADIQGRYIFKNNTKVRSGFPQYFSPTGAGGANVVVQISAVY